MWFADQEGRKDSLVEAWTNEVAQSGFVIVGVYFTYVLSCVWVHELAVRSWKITLPATLSLHFPRAPQSTIICNFVLLHSLCMGVHWKAWDQKWQVWDTVQCWLKPLHHPPLPLQSSKPRLSMLLHLSLCPLQIRPKLSGQNTRLSYYEIWPWLRRHCTCWMWIFTREQKWKLDLLVRKEVNYIPTFQSQFIQYRLFHWFPVHNLEDLKSYKIAVILHQITVLSKLPCGLCCCIQIGLDL